MVNSRLSRPLALGTAAAVGALVLATTAAPASAATDSGSNSTNWAPAGTATIHPGVVTVTKDAGACTGNFIFTDAKKNVYIGQAAHCSGKGEAQDTNGCETESLPLGTEVLLGASGVKGKLAYSSWRTMQARGEKNDDACQFNDFGLVKIPRSALDKVNPSIPFFGGPTGLNTTGAPAGEQVSSYGNSPLRQGLSMFSPKTGTSLGDIGDGWSHQVYTLTPGIPGDSGSAFLDSQGRALGTLSTLVFAPQPLSNQVSDLSRELEYARQEIPGLRLVEGTTPFQPQLLPIGS
jgi:hypothetical protein